MTKPSLVGGWHTVCPVHTVHTVLVLVLGEHALLPLPLRTLLGVALLLGYTGGSLQAWGVVAGVVAGAHRVGAPGDMGGTPLAFGARAGASWARHAVWCRGVPTACPAPLSCTGGLLWPRLLGVGVSEGGGVSEVGGGSVGVSVGAAWVKVVRREGSG